MRYPARPIQLQSGAFLTLASPGPENAQSMLDFLKRTADETPYLISYPEEITYTLEEERMLLEGCAASPRKMMIAAFDGDTVVGNIGINPIGERSKLRHRCGIGIAVRRNYWGCGLGTLFVREAITAARTMGFAQMELGVYTDNERAIHLYEKEGFAPCGSIPNAFRLKDGTFRNELQMIKTL